MDNNKNRKKDREKSNAELRKMYHKNGAEIGEAIMQILRTIVNNIKRLSFFDSFFKNCNLRYCI